MKSEQVGLHPIKRLNTAKETIKTDAKLMQYWAIFVSIVYITVAKFRYEKK